MTIRRQWLFVLIFVAVLSIAINTMVLSTLTNRYFVDYTVQKYNEHYEQIIAYAKKALIEKDNSVKLLAIDLEAQLSDQIYRIKLYDAKGRLLVDVNDQKKNMGHMMKNKMMNRMMGRPSEEIEQIEIKEGDKLLGQLNITRYSSVENSTTTRMFRAALISDSFISFGIVLAIAILIGSIVSKRMSRDLINTASLAQSIDIGDPIEIQKSKIMEIKVIQQSLEALKSKLRLKQKSRKKLIDELVHQTRTPLTILKTHLEGFEDGLIQMESEEIKTCEAQIEHIGSIIENMSQMIDTEKETESLNIEEFEINQHLKQIINGLKVQFDKKEIDLQILTTQKIVLKTDKYKVSQAIYNLLTNAYKFTQSQGKVEVSYMAENGDLYLTIEDNGIGIRTEDVTHIFDAYYQGKHNHKFAGEGLGLYIVKENLEKVNGSIQVFTEVGKGSKFILKIPQIL